MSINLDKLREDYERLNGKKTSGEGNLDMSAWLKLNEGTNIIRFLPSNKPDTDPWYRETIYHRFSDSEGKLQTLQCRKVIKEACPMCDLYFGMWKEHDVACKANNWDRKKIRTPYSQLASKLKPSSRFFANVVDRESKEVKIFSIPGKLMSKIIGDIIGDFGDITDLKNGNDYKVVKDMVKSGDQVWPNYDKSSCRPKKEPTGSAGDIEKWMGSLHDLNALVTPTEEDKLHEWVQKLTESVHVEYEKFVLEKSKEAS